jgi:predicted HAD superfamily Cof-like phosphohydrolase
MDKHNFNPKEMGLKITSEFGVDQLRDRPIFSLHSNFELVKAFTRKFFPPPGNPDLRDPKAEEVTLKIRLMVEELAELVAAMQLNLCHPKDEHFTLVADSIADLLYVTYGAAVSYGINIDAILKEVHRSNMTKSLDKDDGGKVIKGEDFEPPNLKEILWPS